MVKKRIIVKGNVQGVGYRALVRWYANELGVAGRVRNLPDQSVEIYCEGDAEVLKRFIKAIDVKSKDIQMLRINVKSMTMHEEGTKEYLSRKAPKRFQGFEIYYGPGLKMVDRAAMERDELIILAAQDLSNRVDGVGQNIEGMGHKVDGVGQDVRAMHNDMNERFTELDGKYHVISEALLAHTKALEALVEDYIAEKRKHKDKGES